MRKAAQLRGKNVRKESEVRIERAKEGAINLQAGFRICKRAVEWILLWSFQRELHPC